MRTTLPPCYAAVQIDLLSSADYAALLTHILPACFARSCAHREILFSLDQRTTLLCSNANFSCVLRTQLRTLLCGLHYWSHTDIQSLRASHATVHTEILLLRASHAAVHIHILFLRASHAAVHKDSSLRPADAAVLSFRLSSCVIRQFLLV